MMHLCISTHTECPSPKQVGSPTKARAGFIKNGLPLRWEAAVGYLIGAQCYF